MSCANTMTAPAVLGLNTLLLTSSSTQLADMISVAATSTNDGNLVIPRTSGTGAMSVATMNIGTSGRITFTPTTTPFGQAPNNLPVTLTICPTNAQGECLSPPAASASLDVLPKQTLTFSMFAAGRGQSIPYNPAYYRVFFLATENGTPVGETSVAIQMK